MHLEWLLLLHAIITFTVAYDGDNNKHYSALNDACAITCTGVSTEVKYEIGRSYVFDVTSRTILKIGDERDTDVTQNAQAHISVHSPCEFSLKLTRTSLRGMQVESDWSAILERSSLRFAFDDGKVIAICPNNTDPIWAINIKRSILSTFQITHEGIREIDISGDCPIIIEKQKINEILNLKTTKQLNSCYRKHDIAGIRAIPYRLESKIQMAPMIEAKQICERQIAHNNLQQVTCMENYHIISPYSNDNIGMLKVEQTLRAIGITNSAPQESFNKRLSITFDYGSDNFNQKNSLQFVKKIIDELCESNDRIDANTAIQFANLVYNLRGLSLMELSSIANLQCDIFIDALSACASSSCIQQIGNLINSRLITNEFIFSSLAMLSNPTIDIINSIATFIDNIPFHGFLAISSLVQSYCITHSNCQMELSVQRIIHSISSKLPSNCYVGQEFDEIKKAVIILKSIGNIGYEEYSLSLLSACISNDQISNEIKIAAIDALRRKPCTHQRNSKIIELFRNQKENTEVRIIAFRQLMECANDELLKIIIEQLNNETINQVGSYIWSYLNTKQRSTNPGIRNLQYILKRFHIPKRYNLDLSRFSRYSELGYFDKENNYGGHMDTSILLIPNGYIPRQIAFNFTIHLFGKSINILEIGARAEGLEKADEELFGADGYISNPNGHIFREKQFQSKYSKLNYLNELYRRRNRNIEDLLRLTIYIRMFGDDLYYYGYQMEQHQLIDKIKENIEIDKVLAKLMEEKTKKLSRYMLLFELSQTLPTLSGLSFQFLLNVSFAAKLNSKLKLNFVNLLQRKFDASSHIDIHPSISIARSGTIVLRAGNIVTGAMITSNLYAATTISQTMEMIEGKKLLFKIDIPHKELFVTKISHDIIKIDSNRYHSLIIRRHSDQKIQKRYCSGDILAKILGIQACIDFYANFPVMEGSIKVEKIDHSLNSFEFLLERISNRGEQKLLIRIDTPGSKINRKIETDFEISIPRKKLKVGIVTPIKTIVLDGNLQQMQQQLNDYATNLKLIIDDKVYILDGILKITKQGELNLYKLNARSIAKSVTIAEITTELQFNIVKPYAMFDFHLDKIFDKAIIFKILINPQTPKYEGKLEYLGPNFNGKFDTTIIHQGMINLKGTISGEYQIENYSKQTLEIGFEQIFQRKGSNHHFKNAIYAISTAFNRLDFQIISNRTGNNIKNLLDATYFGKKFLANLDVIRDPNNIYTAIGRVKCDQFDIDNKLNIIYQNHFPLQFMLKIDVETPKIRNIQASAEYAIKVNPKWNFKGNMLLRYFDHEITLNKQIDEVTIGQYKMQTHLQWNRNERINALSDIIFRPRENEYTIESTVNVAGLNEPLNIRKHIKYNYDYYNIQWHAKQGGQTIYDLKINLIGQFGNQQKINFNIYTEKFEPKINYQMTGELQPSMNSITALATIRKDGNHFGTGSIILPKTFNLPNQQYRGEFNWIYQQRPNKIVMEYNQLKHSYGTVYAIKLESNDDINLKLHYDRQYDKIIFKCDLDKNHIRTISMTLNATSFRWDLFEIETHLSTDKPLQQQSIKTKGGFLYRTDQANIEGLFEINDKRYGIEGNWRKIMHDETSRAYIYASKFMTPQIGINFEQQLEVEKIISIRKAKTIFALINAGRILNLTNEIKNDITSISAITDIIGNEMILKHTIEYNHRNGQRILNKYLKFNEKVLNMNLSTIYRQRQVQIDISALTNFGIIQYGKIMFDCHKGQTFWNCDAETNVNKQFVIKGYEMLSAQNTDIGYLIKLSYLMNSEGKIKFNIDNEASKYNANAMLRHADILYKLELDVNNNKGIVKFQTPTYLINPQVRIIRKGPTEFEIHSENESGGRIYAHIKTGDYDKLLKMKITEIPEAFELHLENSLISDKQKSIAKLTVDPSGKNKTFGIENEIEVEGETFRALRSTVIQPKRTINIAILRPTNNKYALSVQPNVGGRRQPTVAEMTYQKTIDGYHWEGSISDQALITPLQAKIIYKKDEKDKNNYRLDLQTEFIYSNQPDKLFANSFHLHRSTFVLPEQNKRIVVRNVKNVNDNVRFVIELKSTHQASNLNTRLWTKIDRSVIGNVAIPVRAIFGLETRNLQHQPVEYSLETRTDAVKFTEIQLKSPNSMLKARIDKINDNHYKVGFYENYQQPSIVGELNLHNNKAIFEYRNERLKEVKLHASIEKLNDYEAEINLWHSEVSKKIQDARLTLQVKEGNVWKSNIYIRPTIENEIIKKTKEIISKSGEFHQNSFIPDVIRSIFLSHKQIANDIVTTALDEIIKQWTTEQRNFAAEFGSEYAKLVDEIEINYEIIKEAMFIAYDQVYQEMEQFVKGMTENDFISRLKQLFDGSNDIRQEIIASFKPFINLIDQLYKEMDNLQQNAAMIIERLEEMLKLKNLRRALEEYKENFERTDIIRIILYEMQKFSRQYQLSELERAIVNIEINRRRYQDDAFEVYDKIKNFILDKMIVSTLSKLTIAMFDSLDEIQIRQKWQNIINYLRGKITANDMAKQFWNYYLPNYKRLSSGHYELEVAVPYGASSLEEILNNLHPQHFIALKSALIESFGLSDKDQEFAQSLSDTIYTYKSIKLNPWKIISLYESIAYIINGNRFVSFDGRVFAFHHARCEYLLASDLRTQRFALIAIFSSQGYLETIKIELRNDEILFHKSGNIQINGAPLISIPWQKIDSIDGAILISISRKDHWTILKTYDGLCIRCNNQFYICEIILSGRMHGRSNGLLGLNDNEPSNDYNLIDGTSNDQLNVLAEHWAISGECGVNQARDLTYRDDERCQEYFQNSDSPLRLCFNHIRPKPFEQICSNGGRQQHCIATAAYHQICANVGIMIALPHECVRCDGDLHLDDERMIEKSIIDHDIIFVVEERKCMNHHKEKLAQIAQQISHQQRSVRFGWIGFGGEGVHHEPLVHYEQNEALMDTLAFIKQTQQTFESISGIEQTFICPKKALEFTIKHFPFRFASAKSIVLVICKKCSQNGHKEMLNMLLEQNITMHLLTLSKFKTNDGSKIVGMNAKELLNEYGAQIGQRSSLLHPHDSCSVIAQQTFGTVFSLKYGFTIAASRIAYKRESYCFNCQCTIDKLFARNICRPCEAVEPAELVSYRMIDSEPDNDPQFLDLFI